MLCLCCCGWCCCCCWCRAGCCACDDDGGQERSSRSSSRREDDRPKTDDTKQQDKDICRFIIALLWSDQKKMLHNEDLSVISSCASMIGASLIIISYFYCSELRAGLARKLLCFLSLSDFFTAAVYIIPRKLVGPGGPMCDMQSLLGIFFPVSSFLWTDCITYVNFVI